MATQVDSSHQSNDSNHNDFAIPSIPVNPSTASSPIETENVIIELECGSESTSRRCTSAVWNHFEKKVADGLEKTQCNYDELGRKELANAIILHEYPLSIVDHIGFRRYSAALQPAFKCPTRNTIKSDILHSYEVQKVKQMKLLESNESRVAITSNMWTSGNQKRGYMAIMSHFIDNSWNLQSRLLRFIYVPYPHTSEVLSKVLLNCLMDWNVDTKLSTITLDNCNTNDAMMRNIKVKLQDSDLLRNGELLHMCCCAHILNLIVKEGLQVLKEGIEKVRESVVYWTATPKRVEKFNETTEQLKVSVTKKLCLDCPTRWNSTYLMLESALLYKEVFYRLKQREFQYNSYPNEEQWEFAKEICARLKLFNSVTRLFSGTKFPTANVYFPKICEIRLSLMQWISSSNKVVRGMATSMLVKFLEYWNVMYQILGVAIILDPRYKMCLLEYYFPKFYGEESTYHIDKIKQLCYDLVNDYHLSKKNRSEDATLEPSDIALEDDLNSEIESWMRMRKRTKNAFSKSEFDRYLEEDEMPRSPSFDILLWWKFNGAKYPMLQAIARDVLAIPISTVASESAFSGGGRVVTPQRSRLHGRTLEALMCANNWLWTDESKGNESGTSTIISEGAIINDDADLDEFGEPLIVGGDDILDEYDKDMIM